MNIFSVNRFWDLLCTPCGSQKTSATTKVFSVRRNINSWSDVASLLIACITAVSDGRKMFELETEIMPFLEENMANLHLPRQVCFLDLEVLFFMSILSISLESVKRNKLTYQSLSNFLTTRWSHAC